AWNSGFSSAAAADVNWASPPATAISTATTTASECSKQVRMMETFAGVAGGRGRGKAGGVDSRLPRDGTQTLPAARLSLRWAPPGPAILRRQVFFARVRRTHPAHDARMMRQRPGKAAERIQPGANFA